MRRNGLAIGVAGALILSGLGAGVASAASPYDSASGAIKRTKLNFGPDRHFIVSAHDGPNGATGSYHATYGQGKSSVGYDGRVTCINAFGGNKATVGIFVTKSTFSEVPAGTYEQIWVVDNGNPASGGQPDAISPAAPQATPVSCTPSAPFTMDTFVTGNVLVKDAGS